MNINTSNDDEMTRSMATGTNEDYFDPVAPLPNHGVEPDLESLSQFNFADPPFFLSQHIYHAITTLTGNSHPDLFLAFAVDQEDELLTLFADWKLQPISYKLRHHHVKAAHQDQFRLYGTAPVRFHNV